MCRNGYALSVAIINLFHRVQIYSTHIYIVNTGEENMFPKSDVGLFCDVFDTGKVRYQMMGGRERSGERG